MLVNKKIIIDPSLEGKPFQVMMAWEKPYMEHLIKKLKPKGDVLEIGFGLGYSASAIQKYNITSHTIIEPFLIKELKTWAKKQKHKVNIVKGYWQKELKNLGKFDCIFFDDAPTDTYKDKTNIRLYKFIYELLNNHVNKNAKLTWFCGEPIHFLCHPNLSWDLEEYKIGIPKDCKYVTGDTLYVPLIKFKKGIVNAYNQKALNNKFELETIN
tara:strand:- start:1191 stop:1826 length:636 start_codon:yes stop_codon:yes gene_type:complete